eukprot:scaffold1170_cov139-Skeletonema_dohrnii-CCMP3373.AAC.11
MAGTRAVKKLVAGGAGPDIYIGGFRMASRARLLLPSLPGSSKAFSTRPSLPARTGWTTDPASGE